VDLLTASQDFGLHVLRDCPCFESVGNQQDDEQDFERFHDVLLDVSLVTSFRISQDIRRTDGVEFKLRHIIVDIGISAKAVDMSHPEKGKFVSVGPSHCMNYILSLHFCSSL